VALEDIEYALMRQAQWLNLSIEFSHIDEGRARLDAR
jgi:hypothetical protein